MEGISNLTNSNKEYGLTQNGNRYEKCNVAKKIGTGVGVAQTVVSTIPNVPDDPSGALLTCGLGIVFTLACRAIGTFVDNSVNKNRMAQADGEAALRNKMQNGEVVA